MFNQANNSRKQIPKNHEIIQLPCQKSEAFKPDFDPQKAIVYLKLRNVGCTHKEAINFLKNRHCKQDTTQIFQGPENFRILKLQKVNSKYIHQVLKGWLHNIPPTYDLGKQYKQSLLEVLISTDQDEKMVQDLNKNINSLKYDYKKQEKFFDQYMAEVEEKIRLTGLDRQQLSDKLKNMNESSQQKNQLLDKQIYTLKNTKDLHLIEIKDEVMKQEKQLFKVALGNYPQVYNDIQMNNLEEKTIKNNQPDTMPQVDLQQFLSFRGIFNKKGPNDSQSFSKEDQLKALSEQFNESKYIIPEDSPKKKKFSKFSMAMKNKHKKQKLLSFRLPNSNSKNLKENKEDKKIEEEEEEEEDYLGNSNFQFIKKDLTKEQMLQIQRKKQNEDKDPKIKALDFNNLNDDSKKNIKNMQKLVKGQMFVKSLFEVTQEIKKKKAESLKQTVQQELNQQEIFDSKVTQFLQDHVNKVNQNTKIVTNVSEIDQNNNNQNVKLLKTDNLHNLLDNQQKDIEKYNQKTLSLAMSREDQARQRKLNIKTFSKKLQAQQKEIRNIKNQTINQSSQKQLISTSQNFNKSYIKQNKTDQSSILAQSASQKEFKIRNTSQDSNYNQSQNQSIKKINSQRILLSSNKKQEDNRRISFKESEIGNFIDEEVNSSQQLQQAIEEDEKIKQEQLLLSPHYQFKSARKISGTGNSNRKNKFINPSVSALNLVSTQYSIPSNYSIKSSKQLQQQQSNFSHRYLQKNSFYEQQKGYKTLQNQNQTENNSKSNIFLNKQKSPNLSINSEDNLNLGTTNAPSNIDQSHFNQNKKSPYINAHNNNKQHISQEQSIDNLPIFEVHLYRQSFRLPSAANNKSYRNNMRNSMDNIQSFADNNTIQEYNLGQQTNQKLKTGQLISPKYKQKALKTIIQSSQKIN